VACWRRERSGTAASSVFAQAVSRTPGAQLLQVEGGRRGFGGFLRALAPAVIARTLEAAKAAGLQQAVLDVDTASETGANTLYERLGFRATQRQQALARHF